MLFKSDIKRIAKSGLFDGEYYLQSYPDIKAARIDPLKHFVKHGWKERRNPSSIFDINFYLSMYPDVAVSGINPLIHYIKYGENEGRKAHPLDNAELQPQPQPYPISKLKKMMLLSKYTKNNPNLIIKVIREISAHGVKKTILKIKNKFNIDRIMDAFIDINDLAAILHQSLKKQSVSLSIGHVNHASSIGGVQRYLWFDTKILNKNEIDSICIFISKTYNKNHKLGISVNNCTLSENLSFKDLTYLLSPIFNNHDVTISIHHCLNWKINELEYFLTLKVPIIAFFHDVFWLETDKFNGLFANNNKNVFTEYESLFNKVLDVSSSLVFPSKFIANKFLATSNQIKKHAEKIVLSPNLICTETIPNIVKIKNDKIKIAYLGYRAEHKGWNLFQSLVEAQNLVKRYDFFHIGSEIDDLNFKPYIKRTANYKEANKAPDSILKELGIDVVLLFSHLAESYSYTMYEAMSACACIITSDNSGNIAQTIADGNAYGKIFQSENDVISFLSNYHDVDSWVKKNPNLLHSNLSHNSFTLSFIQKGKQC